LRWREMLENGAHATIAEIAESERYESELRKHANDINDSG
jgi:hypothetical protein